jgi:hypothetical protein
MVGILVTVQDEASLFTTHGLGMCAVVLLCGWCGVVRVVRVVRVRLAYARMLFRLQDRRV